MCCTSVMPTRDVRCTNGVVAGCCAAPPPNEGGARRNRTRSFSLIRADLLAERSRRLQGPRLLLLGNPALSLESNPYCDRP